MSNGKGIKNALDNLNKKKCLMIQQQVISWFGKFRK